MKYRFSNSYRNDKESIRLDEQDVPKNERFGYLDSIIQNDSNIDGDVNHRIQADWMKWRRTSGVFCDRTIPLHLKGKFYRIAVRLTLLYDTECSAIKQQ